MRDHAQSQIIPFSYEVDDPVVEGDIDDNFRIEPVIPRDEIRQTLSCKPAGSGESQRAARSAIQRAQFQLRCFQVINNRLGALEVDSSRLRQAQRATAAVE